MQPTQRIFTVSQVVRDVKSNLETLYPEIWMEGEISNFLRHSASGHCYFSLKDPGAQMSAVMFAGEAISLKFKPMDGLKVVVRGRLSLYPGQGRFQIILSAMEPQGKGSLQLSFEQLKAKLSKEGLFNDEHKKSIPSLPSWIGVVTSRDGAALQDILTVLNRRASSVRVLVCPVRVQGEGAAEEIAQGIEILNQNFPQLDVILVGRGGGSLEDLWAFNEERVARAIFASRIPVLSCVGHEIDFTIADFVADRRAPTPSAAAEMVCRGRDEIAQFLTHTLELLKRGPARLMEELDQEIDDLVQRLRRAVQDKLQDRGYSFEMAAQKLHLLSPLATLSRGYAITWKLPERAVVKEARDLSPADHLEIQVHKGRIYAQVERTDV